MVAFFLANAFPFDVFCEHDRHSGRRRRYPFLSNGSAPLVFPLKQLIGSFSAHLLHCFSWVRAHSRSSIAEENFAFVEFLYLLASFTVIGNSSIEIEVLECFNKPTTFRLVVLVFPQTLYGHNLVFVLCDRPPVGG